MKNESKHDRAASLKTLKSLNADSAKIAEDPEVFRVGQLMRESASVDLPQPDESLRMTLVKKLDRREQNELAKPVPVAERRRSWVFAVASIATLALAIASVLWISVLSPQQTSQLVHIYGTPPNQEFARINDARVLSIEPAAAWEDSKLNVQVNSETFKSNLTDLETSIAKRNPSATAPVIDPSLNNQLVLTDPAPGSIQDPSKEKGFVVNKPPPINAPTNNSSPNFQPGARAEIKIGNSDAIKETLHALYGDKISITESNEKKAPAQNSTAQQVAAQQDAAREAIKKAIIRAQKHTQSAGGHASLAGLLEDGRDGYGIKDASESQNRRSSHDNAAQMIRMMQQLAGGKNREQYDPIVENTFIEAIEDQALSTFSIDVDTASYSNMRRFINRGQTPPPNSIRIEELVNYFQYDYPQPKPGKPFHVAMEVAECPWQPAHKLVRIGLKAKDVHRDERPASNLVFLLDVSGSMKDPDKLPLLQRGLNMMLDRLNENDRISIVTYADDAGVRLQPTSGDQKIKIRDVIESLSANGSTNGSAGIEQAYELAAANFIEDGTNRVIMATDGDLNVGTTDDQSLVELIKRKAEEDVFLTVLGFGTGNLKDSKLEKLANNGNGSYAYIDSMREARKVLIQQMSGSLVTVAKDVKLQVEFNPAKVKAYRLLGYENRKLANADFRNDKKDAGEIGAGHCVTALYEIVPAGLDKPQTVAPKLKYQPQKPVEPVTPKRVAPDENSNELLTVAISHKQPDGDKSEQNEYVLADSRKKFYEASGEFRFAAAVASFGMLLRVSDYSGNMNIPRLEKIASNAMGEDTSGYRAEFIDLVRQYSGN